MQNEMRERRAGLIRHWMTGFASRRLKMAADEVSISLPFEKVGFDSMALIELTADLEDLTGVELSPSIVFDFTTIEALSARVAELCALDPAELEQRCASAGATDAAGSVADLASDDEQTELQVVN